MAAATLSVIIPANNEELYIARCLEALIGSETESAPRLEQSNPGIHPPCPVEVIVVANACTDKTVAVARGYSALAEARGWKFVVLDVKEGGKLNALNVGDTNATGSIRIYLDADVVVSPKLLDEVRIALDREHPTYASGRLVVARAHSWITRAYARFWCRLPFVADGVPGCGIFAVNAAGRQRWRAFPNIISDDTFVRLQFAPSERIGTPAPFEWPMVEGFKNLVRVRRRQDVGVEEIRRRFPELIPNEGRSPLSMAGLLRLAMVEPVGFCVYVTVALSVRYSGASDDGRWTRGR